MCHHRPLLLDSLRTPAGETSGRLPSSKDQSVSRLFQGAPGEGWGAPSERDRWGVLMALMWSGWVFIGQTTKDTNTRPVLSKPSFTAKWTKLNSLHFNKLELSLIPFFFFLYIKAYRLKAIQKTACWPKGKNLHCQVAFSWSSKASQETFSPPLSSLKLKTCIHACVLVCACIHMHALTWGLPYAEIWQLFHGDWMGCPVAFPLSHFSACLKASWSSSLGRSLKISCRDSRLRQAPQSISAVLQLEQNTKHSFPTSTLT